MIFVVDFGGQTAHLIGRRIRELGVGVKILPPEEILKQVQNEKGIKGIILSGGPASVYEKGAPTIDPKIFSLGIPILGICYGLQLTARLLGGKVISGKKEYGPATLKLKVENGKLKVRNKKLSTLNSQLSTKLPQQFTVWMSHGDEVVSLPKGFKVLGSTEHVPFAFVEDPLRKIIGLQFHPEVEHTEYGKQILENFVDVCGIRHPDRVVRRVEGSFSTAHVERDSSTSLGMTNRRIEEIIRNIKEIVGDSYVIGAVSGGVDSTVAATLTAKAIGQNLTPIHIESGLMRQGTTAKVVKFFTNKLHIKPVILRKEKEFLLALKGKTDPEEKRKAIGKLYIDLFQEECKKYKDIRFLVQGTIYSDVIESKGTKHAANIKSHHNVGGLPESLRLSLIEPIRHLYTDQVRLLAKKLGIPEEIIKQQPHPGPGYTIRILGEVNKKRLTIMQKADNIVVEEMKRFGWYEKLLHSFPVLTNVSSTSVKGDGRVYGEVIAIRAVTSVDRMTADWAKLPPELLQKLTSRLTNEIPEISRVVYDITTKPPATMEWE